MFHINPLVKFTYVLNPLSLLIFNLPGLWITKKDLLKSTYYYCWFYILYCSLNFCFIYFKVILVCKIIICYIFLMTFKLLSLCCNYLHLCNASCQGRNLVHGCAGTGPHWFTGTNCSHLSGFCGLKSVMEEYMYFITHKNWQMLQIRPSQPVPRPGGLPTGLWSNMILI